MSAEQQNSQDENQSGYQGSFSRFLKPDFSRYLVGGKFDAAGALQDHLFGADFILRTALAMLRHSEDNPDCLEDRAYMAEMQLQTYREAVEAGVLEMNRLSREFPLESRLPDQAEGE